MTARRLYNVGTSQQVSVSNCDVGGTVSHTVNNMLVLAECVRTNVVRALVATKLRIILSSFSFFLPLTFLECVRTNVVRALAECVHYGYAYLFKCQTL